MVFNSVPFGAFVLLAWLAFAATPRRWRWGALLAASAVFYSAWDWRYLGLIAALALLAFAYGRRQRGRPSGRAVTAGVVVLLLLPLLVIKYGAFLAGLAALPPPPSFVLPLGISFYTFQLLSYCLDVRAGRCAAVGNPLRLLLYPLYFPHQIAGPIVRPRALLGQFDGPALPGAEQVSSALRIFLWGLLKKVFVADRLAVLVDSAYADPAAFHGAGAWLAFYFFAIQIYCDFSGYTDMAVGISRLFGIELCENFRRPYFATSVQAFWGRWHISLSSWFRDYVYIPLGGNRQGAAGWAASILAVFALSGLWHGANLTFLIWGLYHGGLLLAERLLAAAMPRRLAPRLAGWMAGPAGRGLRGLAVFHLVALGWVLFRAPGWGEALGMLHGLGDGPGSWEPVLRVFPPTQMALAGLGILLVLGGDALAEWGLAARFARLAPPLRWAAYYAAVFLVALFPGSDETKQFIYFQF